MTTTIFNQLVLQDFERAVWRAFWRDLFSRLTRKATICSHSTRFANACRSQGNIIGACKPFP
jgi:hypothetical protein